MSDYDVGVGLSVDGADQYQTNISQAIALTQNYTKVADGMAGSMADLSAGMVGLTSKMTGFTKTQSVALDTAAGYQKMMERVEATAKITGGNFTNLSKVTKGFARDFPVGMGKAVQVMQDMQSVGIKNEKQLEKLGKSFIKFEGVTGGSAKEFMQLNKTMGNGVDQFEKLSDSLVSVTSKMGGSAPAVVAFSKALAPVAQTVGMSQTQVMGLSTAMSVLGEDGYRAANTFNKVLLDMNRSVRDGGPGLKAYADLMGTTSENLKGLLKTSPAEFLSKFTEAVGKGGANTSRMMETLGFDSVRDMRSIMALAQSGGPRKAINEAVKGYGDGSTQKAAEVMFDGLTDSVIELKETMSQTVVNIAQPMLGVAKGQVEIMKGVAKAAEAITGSDVGQGLAKAVGVGSMVGNFAMGGANMLAMVAMGKILKDKIVQSDAWKATKTGWTTGASGGQLAPGASFPARLAAGISGGMYDPSRPPISPWQSFKQASGQTFRIGRDLAGRAMLGMFGNPYLQAAGKDAVHSPSGDAYRQRVTELRQQEADRRAFNRGLPTSAGYVPGSGPQSYGQYMAARAGAFAGMVRGAGGPDGQSFTKALGHTVRGASALTGYGIEKGAGAIRGGLGAIGMNPTMALLAAVAGTGYMAYSQNQSTNEQMNRIGGSSKDIYSGFNDFAEAAGLAGKGLVDFSAALAAAQAGIMKANDTMEKALTISADEARTIGDPGYKTGFNLLGDDKSLGSIVSQAQAVLGANPSPEALGQIVNDIAKQTSPLLAEQAGKQLESSLVGKGVDAQMNYQDMLKNIKANSSVGVDNFTSFGQEGLFGNILQQLGIGRLLPSLAGPKFNEVQGGLGEQFQTAAMRKSYEASNVFGGTYEGTEVGAGAAMSLAEIQKQYEAARNEVIGMRLQGASSSEIDPVLFTANKSIQSQMGWTDEEAIAKGFGNDFKSSKAINEGLGFHEAMAGAAGSGPLSMMEQNYAALSKAGFNTANPDMSKFSGEAPLSEQAARQMEVQFNRVTSSSVNLADAFYGAEKAARHFGKMPTEFTSVERASMSGSAKAVSDYEANPTEGGKYKAAEAILGDVSKGGLNDAQTKLALGLWQAQLPAGSPKQEAAGLAMDLQARDSEMYWASRTPQERRNQQAAQLPQLQAQLPMADSSSTTVIQSNITNSMGALTETTSAIAQVNRAFGALNTQIGSVMRSAGIQAGSIARDGALKVKWAKEDYQTQKQYAKEDNQTAIGRAEGSFKRQDMRARRDFQRQDVINEREFAIQVSQANDDHLLQMQNAEEDHLRQKRNATEDFQTSRVRAERDYNKQVERATRDFQLQEGRSQEDFNKGQTRAGEDYNKNRTRMMQDYAKSMKRLTEDQAKAMYDPFKRMQVEMVMDAGQLVANLDEQAAAVEKQKKTLDKLRELGLTDDTIKALSLSDASKAQQASRLLGDAEGNGALIGKMNASVARKSTAAGALVTDSGNTQTSRMAEDFAQQLARGEEDYTTSSARAQEDFATSQARSRADFAQSMTDTKTDFETSMGDSLADFTKQIARMDEEHKIGTDRANARFDLDMQRMVDSHTRNRLDSFAAFDQQMADAAEDHKIQMHQMAVDFDKQMDRMFAQYKKSLKRMMIQTANAISDVGAQAGAQIQSMLESFWQQGENSPKDPVEAAQQFLDNAGFTLDAAGRAEAKRKMGDERFQLWLEARRTVREAILAAPPLPPLPMAYGDESREPAPTPALAGGGTAAINPTGSIIDSIKNIKWGEIWTNVMTLMSQAFDFDNMATVIGGGIGTAIGAIGTGIVTAITGITGGVTTAITSVWGFLTSTLPDVAYAVGQKLGGAVTWLTTELPSKMSTWAKNTGKAAWEFITSTLPDVKDAVFDKFEEVRLWLGGLPGRILGWMKTAGVSAWNALISTLPPLTGEGSIVAAVTEKFDQAKTWLMGLPGWFAEIFSGIKDAVADKISSGVLGPLGKVVDWMINKFNDLHIPAVNKTWEFDGPKSIVGFLNPLSEDFGKTEKKTITLLNTPRIDFPNIGYGEGGNGGLSALIPSTWYAAAGGIATRQVQTTIAEAGYPEAIIPLNHRGADVLAATMARYLDNTEVRGSQTQQYSSPVINNNDVTYDYRTQFTGAVTVQAQDPDQMAQKLAAKRRRQRLAQPIGGKR